MALGTAPGLQLVLSQHECVGISHPRYTGPARPLLSCLLLEPWVCPGVAAKGPRVTPVLTQELEEGKGGGGIYHKTIFEYQLGSSSEIPKVLRKVRTHVSFNPMPPPPPVRPGLAAFVCCFCCYSHLPVGSFKIPVS